MFNATSKLVLAVICVMALVVLAWAVIDKNVPDTHNKVDCGVVVGSGECTVRILDMSGKEIAKSPVLNASSPEWVFYVNKGMGQFKVTVWNRTSQVVVGVRIDGTLDRIKIGLNGYGLHNNIEPIPITEKVES